MVTHTTSPTREHIIEQKAWGAEFMPMEFTGVCVVTETLGQLLQWGVACSGLSYGPNWSYLLQEITTSVGCCFPLSQITQVLFFDRVSLEMQISPECSLGQKCSRFEDREDVT